MKRKDRFFIVIAILAVYVAVFGTVSCDDSTESTNNEFVKFVITSPYDNVDWQTWDQYKASLHNHTTRSDGGATLAATLEELYSRNYDIVAITDHNVINADWTTGGFTVNTGTDVPLSLARFNEMSTGIGRNGRKMLNIPNTNEQTSGEHLNTFFLNWNNPGGTEIWNNLVNSVQKVQTEGAISRINHPGRYTGAHPLHGQLGETMSNHPTVVNKYANLFLQYDSCLGFEIINRQDGETASDRILWDNILKTTIPQGRNVWGFADDDSHGLGAIGWSFNMFIMPENNIANVRSTLENGNFYAVARVSKREGVNSTDRNGITPVINSIAIKNGAVSSITITASNYTKIDWIYDKKVIKQGETITLQDHEGEFGCYVRANVIGAGGIAFTQAFVIKEN